MSSTEIDEMDLPDYSAMTVDEVRDDIESNEYTIPELRALRRAETDADDPRSTAVEAMDAALDALTAGPDNTDQYVERSDTDAEEEDDLDASQIRAGEGGTEAGMAGVVLPNPYDEDAPRTLRIEVPVATGFAGIMYDEDGTYDIPYRTPNEQDVAGMRVKTALEAGTNEVVLSQDDPLHPQHGADEEDEA